MRLDSEKIKRANKRKVGRLRSKCSNIKHGSVHECAQNFCGGAEENSLCRMNAEQSIENRNDGGRRRRGSVDAQAAGVDANVMGINADGALNCA